MSKPDDLDKYIPSGANPVRRLGSRYTIRLCVIRHARLFEWIYATFANVLLPDVRSMCAWSYGYVLPDELPQGITQRPLWRGAGQWQL